MSTTTRLARATRTDVSRRRRSIAGLNYGGGSRLSSSTDWAFLTGEPYPDGPAPAGERAAMGLPPFGRGVALLANAVAGTDWRAMRWDAEAGVALRIADQPAVLLDPDPTSTPWHYRWAATEDLILYGNHFALYGELDYRTLRPGWLVPLPADDVWVIVDPGNGDYSFTVAGELVGADTLLHVSAGSRSGEVLGRGVLAQYGEWLGGALAAETHSGAYFAGAALPPAVLQSPTVLTQPQADELKAKWRTMTSDREPVILPNGYVLTPIVSNAEQSQLVESRTWNAQLVAMMLGIPSYKLGLSGASMTYQNIESADIEFVRDSVDRYAHPLSEAFSKWLMPRGTSVAWDYSGRMRADAAQTATVLNTLVGAGILTHDEARAMIGRAPLDQSTDESETPSGVPDLTPSEVPQ
jgi:HK97 family phage portal protein